MSSTKQQMQISRQSDNCLAFVILIFAESMTNEILLIIGLLFRYSRRVNMGRICVPVFNETHEQHPDRRFVYILCTHCLRAGSFQSIFKGNTRRGLLWAGICTSRTGAEIKYDILSKDAIEEKTRTVGFETKFRKVGECMNFLRVGFNERIHSNDLLR